MNIVNNPKDAETYIKARESFSGRGLTEGQFSDAMAITSVVDREILKTGKFRERTADYAHAFARTEQFTAMKAETIIRDLYKVRFGQSMNERRKSLVASEEQLTQVEKDATLGHARAVGDSIQNGIKVPFYRSLDIQAIDLATKLDVTESCAKSLMSEAFEKAEGREFYGWGKEVEKQFYAPQIEAERSERKTNQDQSQTRTRSR